MEVTNSMDFKITAEQIDDVEAIRSRIEKTGGPKDHEGMDTAVVFDHTWVDVEEGGLGHVNNQRVVKILTDKGAADTGVLRFDYDPKSMVMSVKGLRVFRKAGGVETVEVEDAKNFEDVPQPARGMFWGPRMYVYRLPRLEVGDAVEIRTYRKGFQVAYLGASPGGGEEEITPPMPGHFYDIVLFEEAIPVQEKRYTLVLPKDKPIRSDVYHGTVGVGTGYDGETVRYTWSKEDLPPLKPEARMAFETDVKTKLVLATLKTWEEKSRWFWEANKDQFGWDEAIEEKVKEVTEGCTTDEQRAEALLHWAAQEIRYIGFSMGKNEGFTIHPGPMTFHERGGVCKEYGGVLVSLLRAAGLDAYPVMTQAGKKVEEIPADQFDHCFTAWKKPDGTFKLLDPTWAPFSREVYCAAEQSQNYLIGTPEGEPLGITPALPPESSLLTFEGEAWLRTGGMLEAKVRIEGDGRSETNMRRALAFVPLPTRKAYFEKLLDAVAPGAELVDFGYSRLDDFTRKQEYSMTFRIPAYHTARNGLLRFRLPLLRLGAGPNFARHLSVGTLKERKKTAMLWYTQKIAVDETIHLPKGYRLLDGAAKVSVDREPAGFEASIEKKGADLRSRADMEFRVRQLEPKAYPAFRDVTQAVQQRTRRLFLAGK